MLHEVPGKTDGQAASANPGRSRTRLLVSSVFIALASCATGTVPQYPAAQGPTGVSRPKAFVCQAFVRPNPYTQPAEKWEGVWGKARPLGTIRLSEPGDRAVSSETFRFRVLYESDRYEGSSIDVFVYLKSNGKLVEQTKFQFQPDKLPSGQFRGGHGFTGLHYVYASESREELQYWCSYE